MSVLAAFVLCATPVVIDGDTLRCANGDYLRLAGIEAPDKPAYCARRERVCTMEQWEASKRSLQTVVAIGPVRYRHIKWDIYRRRIATVWVRRIDLSCYQLDRGHAVYKHKWNGTSLSCSPRYNVTPSRVPEVKP